MMKCVLIVTNFNAGRKRAIKYKKKVIDFVLKYTKSFKFADIDELKELDVTPYDTILALGGDGTVNKVLPYLIDTEKILGIIPCGTANLLAARLGLSSNLNKNLKIIEKNKVRKIDIMSVNEKLSALRLGFGYDSDIICKTPQSLKNKFGYLAYLIAGVLFSVRLKLKEYRMELDNKEYITKSSCLVIANTANMYKNMAYLSKNSYPDDNLIDVFILKTSNPILFFLEILCIIFNIRNIPAIAECIQAEQIRLNNNNSVCHIDGEKFFIKENINVKILKSSVKVFAK